MSSGIFSSGARRKARARRMERERLERTVNTALASVAIGELERLAGLEPESRTAFWKRYAYTPSSVQMADTGRRALLARIVDRLARGDLTIQQNL